MVWGDSALDMNEKAFHCILNLIFATSSMIGTTSEVYTHTQCASVYFDRAKQLMSFNLMEMHNLEVIQIFLLSAVYLQHTNLAQEFVQNIGLAIQIARTLGVQSRESCRLLTNKHEQDLAMRVWFGCIIMDRIAAMTFGSKPQISHEIVKKSAVPPTSAATQQVLRPNTPSSINGDFYSAFCHLHVILGDILESLYPLSSEHPSSPEFGASIPTEKDDILAPQKLTDLFRIEFDLSTWYSGLPPQLQVGIGRTDSRIANVLHARYLCVRLLFFRPFFFQSCKPRNRSHEKTSGPSDEQVIQIVTESCHTKCISSARDIVDFFKDLNNRQTAMSDRNTFPSHWYIISYKELTLQDIYMAATVLIAEYLCPITQSHIPISEIDDLLDQVDDILKCCEPSTNIAHKCRVTLKQLNEKVRSTQREVDRPQALESSRSTGEVSLEDFNYDFGPEGLIMNPLDSYPFSWNDWPISLADIADEGPGDTG
ncbi:transcriptional regulator family: Fungal Specific TF [Aspergillus niger]|nr:transcriptional regulator family: Fungal Specific TF [Aspergillus niger]KAI2840412.1 transcriptional regulator family: Fungal Specific TF [Aspergillus niger]KAI2844545.1 transcriptional regulator family: Fungal Specific TF [Aspergillus niger]KAI2871730.1 transcriptional regulator family: Fungal Specific TF [Aspergillus niger]KAI2895377.1 transcriptional regulator family: Fungal Specific TF [Aspergillus niger]